MIVGLSTQLRYIIFFHIFSPLLFKDRLVKTYKNHFFHQALEPLGPRVGECPTDPAPRGSRRPAPRTIHDHPGFVPVSPTLPSYWKWSMIVDFPMKNGDFPQLCYSLPFWVAQIGAKKNRMSHRNLDLITEIHPLKKKVTVSKKIMA